MRANQLSEREKMQTLDALYTAAGSLSGRKAMKEFLRDLLTESERIMLGRRIMIARLLISGATMREVSKRMNVGLDTVGRIEHWLTDQMPGYENAIAGIEHEYKKRTQSLDLTPAARFAALKRKYPIHFLLFPFPKGYGPLPRKKKQ